MKITARAALVVLTVLSCVGCDQVTKSVAHHYLPLGAPLSLFGGVVRLQHAENPGAFLGLGESIPKRTRLAVFALGGAALAIGVGFWALRSRRLSSIQIVGAALVCGGGLSNLIDRLLQDGNVTDFLNIGVGPVGTGIFNCADVALTLGVAILVAGDTVAGWLSTRR